MSVVRRDEHDVRLAARLLRDLEATETRHLNVEEHHLRRMLVQGLQSFEAVACLGTDDKLRPQFVEGFAQLRAQLWLILGNDGGGRVHASATPAITSA